MKFYLLYDFDPLCGFVWCMWKAFPGICSGKAELNCYFIVMDVNMVEIILIDFSYCGVW